MSYSLSEQKVLDKLGIQDFRHMTKDKVITFATMLDKMDPEVAKKAIEQFPNFVHLATDALTGYKDVVSMALKNNSESSKICFDTYNTILAELQNQLNKPEISFDEKKYYIEQMKYIAEKANEKDRENKQFTLDLAHGFLHSIPFIICAVLAFFGVYKSWDKSNEA